MRRAYDYWQNQPGCCPHHYPTAIQPNRRGFLPDHSFSHNPPRSTCMQAAGGTTVLLRVVVICQAFQLSSLIPVETGFATSVVRVPMLHTLPALESTAEGHPTSCKLARKLLQPMLSSYGHCVQSARPRSHIRMGTNRCWTGF